MEDAPTRFTIRPDDYHVPYAGTAEDGRRFFLTKELFSETSAWVGLFLWKADGQFDEVRVSAIGRAPGLPPGQAAPADSADLCKLALLNLASTSLNRSRLSRSPHWSTAQSSDGRSTATPTARTSSASSPATSSATTRPGTVTATTPDSTSPQPHLCREAVTSRPPATMTVRPCTRSCRFVRLSTLRVVRAEHCGLFVTLHLNRSRELCRV